MLYFPIKKRGFPLTSASILTSILVSILASKLAYSSSTLVQTGTSSLVALFDRKTFISSLFESKNEVLGLLHPVIRIPLVKYHFLLDAVFLTIENKTSMQKWAPEIKHSAYQK
jgi:hypothetical protein